MRLKNLSFLAGSAVAFAAAACSPASLDPVPDSYYSDLEKSGLRQYCPASRKLTSFLPAMGGDAVILKRGSNAIIFDEGDADTGDTLETHDSLVIKHALSLIHI